MVARDGPLIVGTAAVIIYTTPIWVKARIEDVVVDESARGRGVAEALIRAALQHAAASGARTVDLTSRPSRVEAGRLYERTGFKLRDTRLYRYQVS